MTRPQDTLGASFRARRTRAFRPAHGFPASWRWSTTPFCEASRTPRRSWRAAARIAPSASIAPQRRPRLVTTLGSRTRRFRNPRPVHPGRARTATPPRQAARAEACTWRRIWEEPFLRLTATGDRHRSFPSEGLSVEIRTFVQRVGRTPAPCGLPPRWLGPREPRVRFPQPPTPLCATGRIQAPRQLQEQPPKTKRRRLNQPRVGKCPRVCEACCSPCQGSAKEDPLPYAGAPW